MEAGKQQIPTVEACRSPDPLAREQGKMQTIFFGTARAPRKEAIGQAFSSTEKFAFSLEVDRTMVFRVSGPAESKAGASTCDSENDPSTPGRGTGALEATHPRESQKGGTDAQSCMPHFR